MLMHFRWRPECRVTVTVAHNFPEESSEATAVAAGPSDWRASAAPAWCNGNHRAKANP